MPFITVTYPPKYPLTESEKKWLEERETLITENEAWYTCAYCEKFRPNYLCRSALCPVDVGHVHNRDVAEFEARVAVYLAKSPCLTCPDNPQGGCSTRKLNSYGRAHVEACRLKHARLAVEQEMDV